MFSVKPTAPTTFMVLRLSVYQYTGISVYCQVFYKQHNRQIFNDIFVYFFQEKIYIYVILRISSEPLG